jgi:PAS domain S-box-containing protein
MDSARNTDFSRRESAAGTGNAALTPNSEPTPTEDRAAPRVPATGEHARFARQAEVLTVLYNLTDRLHRAENRSAIYEAAMDAVFEGLSCDRAAIVLFPDDGGPMRFVASRGLSEGYRAAVSGHSPWQRNEVDARPILISDLARSDLDAGLNDVIRREGIGALAFLPLVAQAQVVGKFMAYYDRPHAFDREMVELGITIARQLAFALSRMAGTEARTRIEAALFDVADAERKRLAELEALMESVPVAIWVSRDTDCSFVTGNSAAHALFRRPGGANLSLIAPDGQPTNYALYKDGKPVEFGPVWRAAHGETVRDFEMEVRYEDGEARHVIGNATPLRDAKGNLFGAVAAFLDITDRKRYADVQEHLASIVAHSDDAIISKDTNGVILSWNRGAEILFGYTADEIVGRNITTIIPAHLLHEEPAILNRIRTGERIDHFETQRRHKNGTLVDISLTVSPMRNAKGEIVAASKIARDISDRKKAEAQHNLLVAELNHRVKNTLATVVSIARQSFSAPEMREARAAFNARIRGLAQSHARLAEANWTSVELQTLFEDEFAPYRQGGNVHLSGPTVTLSPKAALTLGLAIHELATNAAKYGALSTDTGIVEVTWTVAPDDASLAITWEEKGGPPVAPPARAGFGRLLLERAVIADLNSRAALTFAPEGVRFTAVVPAVQYQAHVS